MADNTDFTHLHAHGEYSLLDGVGTLEHVVEVAAEKGFKALSLTDHGSVSGCLKFTSACKDKKIKPIVGCEIYVVDDVDYRKPESIKAKRETLYHTVVLAKDWDGFVSIMKLLTKAHSQRGFYYKPRVGWQDLFELKKCVVTTACLSGPFKHADWKEKLKLYQEAFGEDFYLEIQPHNLTDQYDLNRRALEMALYMDAKLVATNDFHYANEDECHAQEALLGTRNSQSQSDEDRWDMTPGLYMRSYEEMMESFAVLRGGNQGSVITSDLAHYALLNTAEIVDKCNFAIPKLEVMMPDVDTSELGVSDPDEALVELCSRGWNNRFSFVPDSDEGKTYFERFKKEITIIEKLKFARYFLIVWDIYRFCNKNDIFYGPGRGSGAGSLVCYLLGITNADPLKYGLIFERFINPERIDLPDLDLDFEHERRGEIYQYLCNTYKNVAHISTYGAMNAKMVLKDVARFKELPLAAVDIVTKELEFNTAKPDKATLNLKKVTENPTQYPEYAKFAAENPAVINIAKVLEGQVRQAGVHAGGVIVAAHDLTDRAVVESRKGEPTINFDMYDIGKLGLLKVDVLGSKTVSVLKYTKSLIDGQLENGKVLDLDSIPLDDEKALAQFDIGETTGVFQFESDGIRNLLRGMAPHDINTIITANAMYRPGPLKFKDIYIRQKANPKLIKTSGNTAFDRITAETFGVFIYQEQVMQIAVDVAGYTYPEADTLRKKISKSLGKDKIEEERNKFVDGCVGFGKLTHQAASVIFDQIVDFGRYAFNKSHATTYSLISYYAMWLRTRWPWEFLTASIAYAGDTPKAKEERIALRKEADRLQVKYNLPHINRSLAMCSIEWVDGKKQLCGGFNEVDGIGNAAIEIIIKARGQEPFLNFYNFLERLENKRVVNIGVQEKILKAGLFNGIHNAAEVKQIVENLRVKVKPASKAKKHEKKPEENDLEWLLTALPPL